MVSFEAMQKELQAKQRKIMSGVYYRSAAQDDKNKASIQKRLVTEVKKVAATIPGAVVLEPPGMKKFDRAAEKARDDYKGDWDLMKDLARCTLVVMAKTEIDTALNRVRAHFIAANIGSTNGIQFHDEKIITPESNPAGYSGYTVFVRSGGANADKGEIQINYPAMMYAKSLPEFRNAMPQLEPALRAKYPTVPGGLGHAMYDVYRVQKETAIGKTYAAACKLYYDYFRTDPPNLRLGYAALEAVDKLNTPRILHVLTPKTVGKLDMKKITEKFSPKP